LGGAFFSSLLCFFVVIAGAFFAGSVHQLKEIFFSPALRARECLIEHFSVLAREKCFDFSEPIELVCSEIPKFSLHGKQNKSV
jgi:hypothetical protein